MTWEAIEYRLTGSDPLVCVQWDGMMNQWVVTGTDYDKWFDTLEAAKAYGESIAEPEKTSECDACGKSVPTDEISRCIAAGGVETFACDACRGIS